MLALGVAANIVVFSLVYSLFLWPFPFPDQDRLVYVNERAPRWDLDVVSVNYPDFHQWRQAADTFDSLALHNPISFNLSDGRGAERIVGAEVTHDSPGCWASPILGRMFTAEEDVPNGPRVVVISEHLWRDRFDPAPDVVGRTLGLYGEPFTIVGVLPRRAEFPTAASLWVPIGGDPNQRYQSYSYAGIGRLKAGVSIEQAEQDLLRAQQPIWDSRDPERIVSPFVRPLRAFLASETSATSPLGSTGLARCQP